jgi:hypothetical protein
LESNRQFNIAATEIAAHFGDLLTKTRIRSNVKLAEAPSFGRTIFEHAPDSNGARDYAAFAAEFLGMIGEPVPAVAEVAAAPPAANGSPAADERAEAPADELPAVIEPPLPPLVPERRADTASGAETDAASEPPAEAEA